MGWIKIGICIYFVLLCFASWCISPTNLGKISKTGTVLESAHPEDSKPVPWCLIWLGPRFGWENQGRWQEIDYKKVFAD